DAVTRYGHTRRWARLRWPVGRHVAPESVTWRTSRYRFERRPQSLALEQYGNSADGYRGLVSMNNSVYSDPIVTIGTGYVIGSRAADQRVCCLGAVSVGRGARPV